MTGGWAGLIARRRRRAVRGRGGGAASERTEKLWCTIAIGITYTRKYIGGYLVAEASGEALADSIDVACMSNTSTDTAHGARIDSSSSHVGGSHLRVRFRVWVSIIATVKVSSLVYTTFGYCLN